MVQLYFGDGKGKTTAAIGQAIRMAGYGKQVLIARFLKTNTSGEINALDQIKGIFFVPNPKEFGFVFTMTLEEKQEAKEYYTNMFLSMKQMCTQHSFDLILLDEIVDTCNLGLLDDSLLYDFIKNSDYVTEIILTGREPDTKLLDLCDYISEIKKIKHPYDIGVKAREGIEF